MLISSITGLSRQQLHDRWLREADAEHQQGRMVAFAGRTAARLGHPEFETRFMAIADHRSTDFMRGFHEMQASLRRFGLWTEQAEQPTEVA